MFDIESPVTAAQLASLLGISQRRIQGLKAAGILSAYPGAPGLNAVLSIKKYCAHLREQAAGREARQSTGRLDIKLEAAKLKRAQRVHVELSNKILGGSAIPIEQIRPAWERVARAVQGAVMAAPSALRFRLPHLTAHDEAEIEKTLRDLLNDAGMVEEPPKLEAADPDIGVEDAAIGDK